jgi:hypothetical protein
MQEITIQETQTVAGGSSADGYSFLNGLLSATGFGYLYGYLTTGKKNPGSWGKLC